MRSALAAILIAGCAARQPLPARSSCELARTDPPLRTLTPAVRANLSALGLEARLEARLEPVASAWQHVADQSCSHADAEPIGLCLRTVSIELRATLEALERADRVQAQQAAQGLAQLRFDPALCQQRARQREFDERFDDLDARRARELLQRAITLRAFRDPRSSDSLAQGLDAAARSPGRGVKGLAAIARTQQAEDAKRFADAERHAAAIEGAPLLDAWRHGWIAAQRNARGDQEGARAELQRELAGLEAALGPDNVYSIGPSIQLGALQLSAGQLDAAERTSERALAIARRTLPDELAAAHVLLASVHIARGAWAPAQRELRHATESYLQLGFPEGYVAGLYVRAASAARALDDREAMEVAIARAEAALRTSDRSYLGRLAAAHGELALLYEAEQDAARAHPHHMRALELARAEWGEHAANSMAYYAHAVEAERSAGHYVQAVALARVVIAQSNELHGDHSREAAVAWNALGRAQAALHDYEPALASLRRAFEISRLRREPEQATYRRWITRMCTQDRYPPACEYDASLLAP